MKYIHSILIIMVLFLSSCTQVYFEEAQPAGKRNIPRFPDKLTGLYLSVSGDSILRINKDNLIIYLENGKDLRFSLDDNMVLKKYKGEYYINVQNREKPYWILFVFSRKDNVLYPKQPVLGEKSISKYKEITTILDNKDRQDLDEKQYLLNPGKKELLELIKSDLFENMDPLTKVR